MKAAVFAFVLVAAMVFLAGCVQEREQGEKPLIALASFPLYEAVGEIAGDDFEVWLMQPPGLNAHSYEPTPKEIARLGEADAFVFTGRYFELWAQKASENTLQKGALVIEASEAVELLESDAENEPFDPHVWMSAKNYGLMLGHIAKKLSEKYPEKKAEIEARAAKYAQKAGVLDMQMREGLENCEKKEIYVSHAAFGYLARDYGLEQVPIIKSFEPQGDEVSISELRELVDSARERNVTHVFFEEFVSPKMSEALAREVGATTSVLSPMEAYSREQIGEGRLYSYVMRENLKTLEGALGCG